ncbi:MULTISPECIES: PIN domain-containing protein [unclassified Geodermatophilus]
MATRPPISRASRTALGAAGELGGGPDVVGDHRPQGAGLLAAEEETILARRADTLALARESDPIPVSEAVMSSWARLVVDCRRAGVHRTVTLTDALVAATAVVHGLPVVTQDEDVDRIAAAHSPLRVLRV